jgi:hypothetical protein
MVPSRPRLFFRAFTFGHVRRFEKVIGGALGTACVAPPSRRERGCSDSTSVVIAIRR